MIGIDEFDALTQREAVLVHRDPARIESTRMSATLSTARGPPRKPPEGDACNGCGLCCAVQLCPIVIELLPDAQAPCPAMEFSGERFWCGLIRRPSRYLGTPCRATV